MLEAMYKDKSYDDDYRKSYTIRYTVSIAAGPIAALNSQTHATPVQILLVHSDVLERLHLHILKMVLDNLVPPHNEARLAPSSNIRDTRAPATNKKHPNLHEVVDDHSEDENYDSEVDEVESFDDPVDDLFAEHEVECQGNANSKKKDTDYWVVDVIENGVTYCMELTVKEALALTPGKKIALNHNRELQQVGQAAGLLSGLLGTLASNFQQLPICEKSWKTTSKASMEHAFDQFKVIESSTMRMIGRGIIKREIVQRIGSSKRNARNYLFHKFYDKELTFEENLKRKPEKCKKMPLIVQSNGTHILEELRQVMPIGRGDGWIMSHKKKEWFMCVWLGKQLNILRAKTLPARNFHRMIPLHKCLERST
ncbi:hypothetical protein Ahy_A01g003207 [Arachis hypogaea]|uniref:Uncharacterized protein n=1 Tax=Arachis hypogaea TaxID=3818 RepID=A0A445ESS8_ARAHY|nr:hypothetical protein Ahy_A01g003207 [Arachis hypogaea]